jgi:hypothetical protein
MGVAKKQKESPPDIIKRCHPVHKTASVYTRRVPSAKIPSPMRGPNLRQQGRKSGDGLELDYDDHVVALYEWLSLLSLDSPRIRKNDAIDPYLSRYAVPNDGDAGEARAVVRVKWTGFLPIQWFSELWLKSLSVESLQSSSPLPCAFQFWNSSHFNRAMEDRLSVRKLANDGWFALVAHEFESGFLDGHNGLTLLRLPPPNSPLIGSSAGAESRSQAADAAEARDEFLLWEFSSGSN